MYDIYTQQQNQEFPFQDRKKKPKKRFGFRKWPGEKINFNNA